MAPESSAVVGAIVGATGMASATIGLIFLRHWRRTGERLFAFFAAAFWLMALNRAALAVVGDSREATSLYVVRLMAFLLILTGAIGKNVRGSR